MSPYTIQQMPLEMFLCVMSRVCGHPNFFLFRSKGPLQQMPYNVSFEYSQIILRKAICKYGIIFFLDISKVRLSLL